MLDKHDFLERESVLYFIFLHFFILFKKEEVKTCFSILCTIVRTKRKKEWNMLTRDCIMQMVREKGTMKLFYLCFFSRFFFCCNNGGAGACIVCGLHFQ